MTKKQQKQGAKKESSTMGQAESPKEELGGQQIVQEQLIEQLQRLQAEFDNYKKWVQKDKEEFVKFSNRDLMLKLLDVSDSFESALKNENKGLEGIYEQLKSILRKEGLEEIRTLGERFNTELHEVMMKEESEEEEDMIIEEIQKGYLLNGKVLRHAKVKVSKGSNNERNPA